MTRMMTQQAATTALHSQLQQPRYTGAPSSKEQHSSMLIAAVLYSVALYTMPFFLC
jgi:hypothetical protein